LTEEKHERKCIAAVRIRGTVSAKREARETLRMLRLSRNNHAVLIDDRPSFLGMLEAAQHYITWGEASKETVSLMLKKKGSLGGKKKLSDEYAQKNGYKSLDDLAEAIATGHAEYWNLPNVQPVFMLHPPTKGFRRTVKKSYGTSGELGYRGEKINELLQRML
jgi:large subunit ribosomal protein L30